MPSSQTRIKAIERKIAELDEKSDMQEGLSESNARTLEFFRLWRHYAGKDVVLVIRSRGVLSRPGEVHQARIVECHDQVAADLIAFAAARGQTVREATDQEIALYRERNRLQQEQANRTLHQESAKQMRANLEATLGIAFGSGVAPGGEDAVAIPPATIPADPPAENPADMVPVVDPVPVPHSELTPGPDGPLPGVPELRDAGVAQVASEHVAELLVVAGITTVRQLAEQSPGSLSAIKGIGESTAAKLVVEACELVATWDGETAAA